MTKDDRALPDLTFHRNEGEAPTWDCTACGEPVHTQIDGAGLYWLIKSQAEHRCAYAEAEKNLPGVRDQLRAFLEGYDVSLEVQTSLPCEGWLQLRHTPTGAMLNLDSDDWPGTKD